MKMPEDVRKDIETCLKGKVKRARLPREISVDSVDDDLRITLTKEGIGFCYFDSKNNRHFRNMQEDCAAFEGWALVIKAYWNTEEKYNICIDVDIEDELPDPQKVFPLDDEYKGKLNPGHYGRFLYRAKRFSEEFSGWVKLSDKVSKAVDIYFGILRKNKCTNHLPGSDAGINEHSEIKMETLFSLHPDEIQGLTEDSINGKVNRQLGCWLESEDNGQQFLTAGRSAIDLWNINGDILNIFELKAVTEKSNNAKVGIITELFFYAEYCNDLYVRKTVFEPRPGIKDYKNDRGYYELTNTDIKKIVGYFLTNKYHPLVAGEVVTILNKNKSRIKFKMLDTYDMNKMMNKYKAEIAKLLEEKQKNKLKKG